MGIKSFTQVFQPYSEFKYKDFKGKNVVIDASIEIYRSALGMKKLETLTDDLGNPTGYINIILFGVILKLKASGANQYWIFDYYSNNKEEFHNPLKELELKKRKQKRATANAKIVELKKNLKKTSEQELFSDDDDSDINTLKINTLKINATQDNIDKQEKAAFVMKRFYTDDIIFILNMLDIPWIECPAGYDAEQIAAFSTNTKDIFGKQMDYVLTPDADTLMFGAKKLIKKDVRKKKLFEYDLKDILKQHNLSHDDFIKIGVILGTDFAPKTPKIGPKTVLKKYKEITLTEDQLKAISNNFKRVLTKTELSKIKINNIEAEPFSNKEKYLIFLDWVNLVKNYNRDRIIKGFQKIKLFEDTV